MWDSVYRVQSSPAWCQSESEQSVLTINMGTGGSSCHTRAVSLYIASDKPFVFILTDFNFNNIVGQLFISVL